MIINSQKGKMNCIGEYERIAFFKYQPSLLKPYYSDYPKQNHPPYEKRLIHKIRMALEYIRGGYRVYYMAMDNDIVGHIVVANGGRRVKESNKKDIVLGPVFISPDMRGHGIGTTGIYYILHHLELNYKYAYEFIADTNNASIRTVEKNSFEFICKAKEAGLMKRIVEDEGGSFMLFRFARQMNSG